jgi:hypothetical protein
MSRSRATLATGIAAGIAANYWLLEGLLADRTDTAGGWVSDLGARSESTGWIFDLLDVGAGALLLAFALLVRASPAARGPALRWGSVALVVTGVCSLIDGVFPLSCAESLPGSCELDYDAVDLVHIAETFVAIAATVAAFALLAAGFLSDREPRLRRLGMITAVAGTLWVLCNLMMGGSYLIDDLESVRGTFHRASQVILGAWLIALAMGLSGIRIPRGAKPSPGLGRIDGDGEATEQVRLS